MDKIDVFWEDEADEKKQRREDDYTERGKVMEWGMPAVLVLACFVGNPEARGDAIAPAPACPPGSQGQSSHAGQWCAPAPCKADSDCKVEGVNCRRWRVCVRETTVSHNRRRPTLRQQDVVVGTCPPGKACKGDEEPPPPQVGTLKEGAPRCSTGEYCVPASLPPLPQVAKDVEEEEEEEEEEVKKSRNSTSKSRRKGCGCQTSSPVAHNAPLVLLAAALLLLARRRR